MLTRDVIPVFLGFRVKRLFRDTAWLHQFGGDTVNVREICSVSDCMSKPPDEWEKNWDFNAAWCYNTEQAAWATVPPELCHEFDVFALRMFPWAFDESGKRDVEMHKLWDTRHDPLPKESGLDDYSHLGYDVAGGPCMDINGERSVMLGFSCSPLSCNGMAQHYPVNRYCLIPTLDEAVVAAQDFGRTEPEPGPFYLYEVLRRRSVRWQP